MIIIKKDAKDKEKTELIRSPVSAAISGEVRVTESIHGSG